MLFRKLVSRRTAKLLSPATFEASLRRWETSYVQGASHDLILEQTTHTNEIPIYNENQVEKWLAEFKGGSVSLEQDDASGLATITIANAGKKNAFTGQMMTQLGAAIHKLDNWPQGKALILKGEGATFCSGGDLAFVNEIAEPMLGCRMSIFMQEVTSKLYRLPLVTVALIQGHALGGGAELAMACDLRVFGGGSKSRLGVSTGWGGGTHLVRLVGPKLAFRLLVSGRILGGEEALRLGLIDKVIDEADTDKLQEETLKWLDEEFLSGYGSSIQALKRMVFNVNECGYAEALNRERDIFTRLWGSDSHLHALQNVQKLRNLKP